MTNRSGGGRHVVGAFFLFTSGVHLGLVVADPGVYRHFADEALLGFVREAWSDIVMAHPRAYGLLLMAGEAALGVALLVGGRAAVAGWCGVIAFHLALLVFGWWAWLWSIPALLLLVFLARSDLASTARARPPLTR